MRRIVAILLVALFGLTTAAPLLAATQQASGGSHLPACCRRDGAHHCTMALDTDTPSVTMRCPHAPTTAAVVTHAEPFALIVATLQTTALFMAATPEEQAEQNRRLSRERTRHKRGPPTILLIA